jgi:hypothetical protein
MSWSKDEIFEQIWLCFEYNHSVKWLSDVKWVDDRDRVELLTTLTNVTMQLVIECKSHFAFSTLMCKSFVLIDDLRFNVIFVLIEKITVLFVRLLVRILRVIILLVFLVQEETRILILIIVLIIVLILIIWWVIRVIILLRRVNVCFLSFISIIIVSILIVSRSFEESILKIVIFLVLLCRHIIVWTKCEIFSETKEIRLRRESELFWWVDDYLQLRFRCL